LAKCKIQNLSGKFGVKNRENKSLFFPRSYRKRKVLKIKIFVIKQKSVSLYANESITNLHKICGSASFLKNNPEIRRGSHDRCEKNI
jgi:hypothetical protein